MFTYNNIFLAKGHSFFQQNAPGRKALSASKNEMPINLEFTRLISI
jgi:hypothetical protein